MASHLSTSSFLSLSYNGYPLYAIKEYMAKKKQKNKRGPKPDTLKIDDDWEQAMKKAIRKEKPEEGWPDQNKKKD